MKIFTVDRRYKVYAYGFTHGIKCNINDQIRVFNKIIEMKLGYGRADSPSEINTWLNLFSSTKNILITRSGPAYYGEYNIYFKNEEQLAYMLMMVN